MTSYGWRNTLTLRDGPGVASLGDLAEADESGAPGSQVIKHSNLARVVQCGDECRRGSVPPPGVFPLTSVLRHGDAQLPRKLLGRRPKPHLGCADGLDKSKVRDYFFASSLRSATLPCRRHRAIGHGMKGRTAAIRGEARDREGSAELRPCAALGGVQPEQRPHFAGADAANPRMLLHVTRP